jgi:hypothetical protein
MSGTHIKEFGFFFFFKIAVATSSFYSVVSIISCEAALVWRFDGWWGITYAFVLSTRSITGISVSIASCECEDEDQREISYLRLTFFLCST